MTASLLLLAVLTAAEGRPPSGIPIDAGVLCGVSLQSRSMGEGTGGGAGFGLMVGSSRSIRERLGARAELLLVTDTLGGGEGDGAVELSSAQIELLALAGLGLELHAAPRLSAGVELLAGPGLRLTYVDVRIYGRSSSTLAAGAVLAFALGAYATSNAWRFGARFLGAYPFQRLGQAQLLLAYTF